MSILITGADGQLGKSLQSVLSLANIAVISPNKSELNITAPSSIKRFFSDYKPQWVLNTAAYTNVDLAETQQELCHQINAEGPRFLAEACDQNKAKLIHFSTDYVFDGKKSEGYVETDPCAPLSVYGKTKWEGEQAIQNTFDHYIIMRVSWLFSPYGKNFVKTIVRLLNEKPQLKIINDQRGCPTYTHHIALIVKQIISQHPEIAGIFHYSDAPISTWYNFACAIQEHLVNDYKKTAKDIIPIPSTEYPTPASRPMNSVLNCEKLTQQIHMPPFDWRIGLQQALKEIVGE